MKTGQRRWMKWVLAESAKPGIALPWHRSARQTAQASRPTRRMSADQSRRD